MDTIFIWFGLCIDFSAPWRKLSVFYLDICSGPPLRPLSSCFSICQLAFRRCQFSCVGAFTLLHYISHHGIFLAWTIVLYSLLFLLQTMFSLWFGVTWNLKLVTFFFSSVVWTEAFRPKCFLNDVNVRQFGVKHMYFCTVEWYGVLIREMIKEKVRVVGFSTNKRIYDATEMTADDLECVFSNMRCARNRFAIT